MQHGELLAAKNGMMDPATIQRLGFTPARTEVRRRLLCQVAAPKGFGKTTFALTGPEPIYYYKLETGDEGVVEPFAAAGREIYTYRAYYNRANWKEEWTKFLDSIAYTCLEMKDKPCTFVFDTMSEVYEFGRMAHFGGRLSQVVPREYGVIYADMREIIRNVEACGASGIFIQKMGPSFDNKAVLEVKGWDDIKWDMQVLLSLHRVDATPEYPGIRYIGRVDECRQNGRLVGTQLENGGQDPLNIEHLMRIVHG